MSTSETPQISLLEASTESFQKGLVAFREGDKESAKPHMQEALTANPYDIGAMVILSLIDPEFEKEKGLFSSEAHRKAFVEITKSPHAKNLRRVGNNLVLQLATYSDRAALKIVDIGIGTAVQEAELIRQLADSTNVKKVEIIGIEPVKEMSGMALQRLQSPEVQNAGVDIDFQTVNATGQNIPEQCIDGIRGKLVDVVLATISIHHATIEEKRKTLRAIRAMNPKYFVLADVNSDHESDLPKFSDELADNVRRFYSLAYQTLCEWADKNFPGREDIKAAFKKFNFDEARNILSRDYPNVADYHTTADRWRQLMQEEGFKIVNPQSIKGITDGLEGDIEVTDDTVYMLITENRKLFFALIAEPIK